MTTAGAIVACVVGAILIVLLIVLAVQYREIKRLDKRIAFHKKRLKELEQEHEENMHLIITGRKKKTGK